ncbi:N,N-dimethylformamidase beta subunit family domain-containing protein, partial [Actinotalea sp.]|uniref:N,N-dimethylformamidase beta subunit family domain-containing protein n=1 Tax=Actinotalea sp. TaxID=1872145 RepID=UPI0035642CB0
MISAARGVARLTCIAVASLGAVVAGPASADPVECVDTANPVACENAIVESPAPDWDIEGAGDPTIQGFATEISVDAGETIDFKIDTPATSYTIDVYRTGWYGGNGARTVASLAPSATLPQTQPVCMSDPTTQLYDCGNWGVSASWTVPSTAVSGVYVAKLTRTDVTDGGSSHIIFVVRDDSSTSEVVFQTSDTTWQAYNSYGGADFYMGASEALQNGSQTRAYKLSYNRPFVTREGVTARDFYFSSEYAMVRFLERNGFDVSYIAGVDADRSGSLLLNHRVFLSVGHDEYWSGAQRANVEAARDAGVNLAFFAGNEVYWRTRWEPSVAGTATDYRTLVSYKETWSNAKVDPSSEWTGTWRDPRFASQANGGGLPENGLTGTAYTSNFTDLAVTVSADEGKLRLWRNTGLDAQAAGTSTALAPHTVGYESNEDLDNGFRPAGLIRLSTVTGAAPEYLQDYGNTTAPGTTTHHLTMYRAPSGALVFGAGTIQWAWGLDQTHDGDGAPADARMQQATVNVLADMGAQPATLMAGLVAASASTDTTGPTVTITSPVAGAAVANGAMVTATGTASDVGGRVAGVEVSTDGGTSWHPASGTTSWTYSYVQHGNGTTSLRVRAVDDSANIGSAASVDLTVSCPCSVFGAQVPATAAADDSSAVELGLRFSPTSNGFVTGVRFYKGTGNAGTHVGSLWSASGARLAQVTFTDESATGWQQATFSTPVAVSAGTTYTVSYTAPQGRYAIESDAFYSAGIEAPPLRVAGGFGAQAAGVYAAPGVFPSSSFGSSNYFVDVLFDTTDTSPLTLSGRQPLDGATSV